MLFFGKNTVKKAEETARKADRINEDTQKKINDAEDKSRTLHDLLEANGITLRIYIAKGGDRHNGRQHI